LPVSGIEIVLSPPTGREDLILLEVVDEDVAALALAEQLGRAADGATVAWPQLTPTDLDTFVMRLRQARLGDLIRSHVDCHAEGCAAQVDISFGVEAYLDFHRPRRPAKAPARAQREPGWFWLGSEDDVLFRLPTVADVIQARREADPARALAGVCLRLPAPSVRGRRRLESAMSAMAPPLSSELEGACPDCGVSIRVAFEPRTYCLRELRDRARFVFDDVDLLASRYHWAEESILGLPTRRRQAYVELALGGG
jgi:hypothetical protein